MNLSTLTGSELSTRVAELRGWNRVRPVHGSSEIWWADGERTLMPVSDYRPDRDVGQAWKLLENGIVHWSSASLPESSRGKYGVSFSVIINGGPTYSATAWSNVYSEAFARAICEAWVEATKNEKARETDDEPGRKDE